MAAAARSAPSAVCGRRCGVTRVSQRSSARPARQLRPYTVFPPPPFLFSSSSSAASASASASAESESESESESAVDCACRITAVQQQQQRLCLLLSSAAPAIRVVARQELAIEKEREGEKSTEKDQGQGKGCFSVAIISGGGSGHEPAHAGFVGRGGLSAAVCGDVFASPSAAAVLAAILHCHRRNGGAGVLLVIKNYTGDRLQFGLAAEQARALGVPVEMVIAADDVALGRGPEARGLAGAVLVYKIASAYAEAGASLEEVKRVAEQVASRAYTLGVAFRGCSLATGGSGSPSAGDACDRIPAGTMEVGLGIHGEPGAEQVPRQGLQETASALIRKLEGFVGTNEPHLTLLINNLGGMTPLEMAAITAQVVKQMPAASYMTGAVMTSLDMRGFSITVVTSSPSPSTEEPELLQLLAAPAEGSAWPALVLEQHPAQEAIPEQVLAQFADGGDDDDDESSSSWSSSSKAKMSAVSAVTIDAVTAACAKLVESQGLLNDYDSMAGDGDCGSTLSLGASAIIANLKPHAGAQDSSSDTPAAALEALLSLIARSIRQAMGGSSGALLDIFFTAAAASSATTIGAALRAGLDAMMRYGGAAEGQRTMLDALGPAVRALEDCASAARDSSNAAMARACASAAAQGSDATKTLKAGAGRARYVPEAAYQGQPDPGAAAVAIVLEALASRLEAAEE